MSGKVVIEVRDVSKQYNLSKIGSGTIKDDINRWWHRVRGKEDPFLQIGEMNDRTKKSDSKLVWALRDLNFDIHQGDVVGIIGRNGAGKSTLLKLLSRTTTPTTGSIKMKGRVASLLEVGTGFHPDLTGRENIFLNGAILGMTKREIASKFDEIVTFSGVERYIDTPVKRYSSGMYVRLAFAVAAHLESEILIVDEVLAVGDAEFQKKALGKMKDVSNGQGKTVLFVSHNMGAVKQLCNKGVLLNKGQIEQNGNVNDVIETYFEGSETKEISFYKNDKINIDKPIQIISAEIVFIESCPKVSIYYQVYVKVISVVAIKIVDSNEDPIITLRDNDVDHELINKEPGTYKVVFDIPIQYLAPNKFKISVSLSDMKSERYDYYPDLLTFVLNEAFNKFDYSTKREGILLPYNEMIGETLRIK